MRKQVTWEQRLRDALHDRFFEMPEALERAATIEDIAVEGFYPDLTVTILFKEHRRPECLFGFHWGSTRPWVEEHQVTETPETLATNVWANWDELFAPGVLPSDCAPRGITWVP